jgi:hypothetical protein
MNKVIVLIVLSALTSWAWAGALTVPNSFTSGTAAVAAEVNDNFTAVKTAVDDNDNRITANEAAIVANAPPVLVDATSTPVGTLLGTDSAARYWVVLTAQKYLVRLRADGFPAYETVYFTSPGCTGIPYLLVNNNAGGATARDANYVYAKQGYVFTDALDSAIYYIEKNTGVSTMTASSRMQPTGVCQANIQSIDAVQAATNVPATTGVPATGFGPLSLQ